MQGDDIGNNVSALNPYINEHSVIYWVINNLDKIDADFIGFCHYRRFFDFPSNENITENDIYINKMNLNISNYLHLLLYHDPHINAVFGEFIQKLLRNLPNINEFFSDFVQFLQSPYLFSGNLFIMHKNNIIKYKQLISHIYNIIFSMIYPFHNYSDRSYGFILERMNSFIISKLAANNANIKQGKLITIGDTIT